MTRKMVVVVALMLLPVYAQAQQNTYNVNPVDLSGYWSAIKAGTAPTQAQELAHDQTAYNNTVTTGGTVQQARNAFYQAQSFTSTQMSQNVQMAGQQSVLSTVTAFATTSATLGGDLLADATTGYSAAGYLSGQTALTADRNFGNAVNNANSYYSSPVIDPPPLPGQQAAAPVAGGNAQQAANAAGIVGGAAGGALGGLGGLAPAPNVGAQQAVGANAANTPLGNAVQSANAANGVGQAPSANAQIPANVNPAANVAGMAGIAAGGVLPGVSGAAANQSMTPSPTGMTPAQAATMTGMAAGNPLGAAAGAMPQIPATAPTNVAKSGPPPGTTDPMAWAKAQGYPVPTMAPPTNTTPSGPPPGTTDPMAWAKAQGYPVPVAPSTATAPSAYQPPSGTTGMTGKIPPKIQMQQQPTSR